MAPYTVIYLYLLRSAPVYETSQPSNDALSQLELPQKRALCGLEMEKTIKAR